MGSKYDAINRSMSKKTVKIIRGISGVGKSTYVMMNEVVAKAEDRRIVCSADDYFVNEQGQYEFVGHKVPMAHQWCWGKFIDGIGEGRNIIVDNTNTQPWEYENYIKLAKLFDYEVEIIHITPKGLTNEELAKRNTHGVPLESIEQMRLRWVDDTRQIDV